MCEDGSRVRELLEVDIRTVVVDVSAIVDVPVFVDVTHALRPVPCLCRPLRVRIVARIPGQPRPEVEKDAIRDRILVIITPGRIHLPPHAAVAVLRIPPRRLGIEHRLRQREPLRLCRRGVLKVRLGRQDGRHAPEALVVVAERGGPVGGHVAVLRGAGLEDEGELRVGVVGRVFGVVPVVDHGAPERAALPPVVVAGRGRTGKDAGGVARLVADVVVHEVSGYYLCGALDRVCGGLGHSACDGCGRRLCGKRRVLTWRGDIDI